MEFEVNNLAAPLNWSARGNERILQNAKNILRSRQGEIPFARSVGIDSNVEDLSYGKLSVVASQEIRSALDEDFGGRCVDGYVEQKEHVQYLVAIVNL